MAQEVINAYLASLQTLVSSPDPTLAGRRGRGGHETMQTHSQPLPTKRGEPENEAKSQSSGLSTGMSFMLAMLLHVCHTMWGSISSVITWPFASISFSAKRHCLPIGNSYTFQLTSSCARTCLVFTPMSGVTARTWPLLKLTSQFFNSRLVSFCRTLRVHAQSMLDQNIKLLMQQKYDFNRLGMG